MTIASYCRAQLLADGPLTLLELAERASAVGVTKARDPIPVVRSSISRHEVLLSDGRWATPLALLEGRWLTTRGVSVSARWEQPPGPAHPAEDLAALLFLLRGGPIALATGGHLRGTHYSGLWRAPRGWPEPRPGAGELLAFCVRNSTLEVHVIEETEEVVARGAALAGAIGPVEERGCWPELASDKVTQRLWPLLLADPALLTAPASPISSCIPGVAWSIRDRIWREREQRERWRPVLDLPRTMEARVQAVASGAELPVADWLNAYVTSRLAEISGDDADEPGFGWRPHELWDDYPDVV